MRRWEHDFCWRPSYETNMAGNMLNERGEDGWALCVAVTHDPHNYVYYYFKRELPPEPESPTDDP